MTCDATCSDVTVTRPRDRDAPQCRVRGLEFGSPFPCLGRNYIYDKPKLTDNPAVRAVWGLGGALPGGAVLGASTPVCTVTSHHEADTLPGHARDVNPIRVLWHRPEGTANTRRMTMSYDE